MGLETLLDQLDPDPKRRGDEFERLCRWYLTNAPEHGGRFEEVWLWKEWPENWGRDAGIDLVAEEHDGGLWAIQAKAYDPAYSIKKADVDSFLSESARPGFVYRLLIATTDRIGENARRTIEGQERAAGLLMRSDLEEAPVRWPRSSAELQPPPPHPRKPRPHQQEALKGIVSGFDSTDRGQAIMACERHYGTLIEGAAAGIARRLDAFDADQQDRIDERCEGV
jgi:predicted helicase